jgi:hypothetical protein
MLGQGPAMSTTIISIATSRGTKVLSPHVASQLALAVQISFKDAAASRPGV